MKMHGVGRVVKIMILVLIAATVLGFAVMWLWNWLMPALFGLHVITYWQALGLLVLSKILFGAFHRRPGFGRDWRARLIRHWEDMSPQERERFRAGMRGRGGPLGPTPDTPKA